MKLIAPRTSLGAVVAVAAAVAVAGCGGSSSSGSSSSGSGKGSTLELARAVDASAAVPGFKTSVIVHEKVGSEHVSVSGHGSVSPAEKTASIAMLMSGAGTGGLGTIPIRVLMTHRTFYVKLPRSLTSRLPGGKPWLSFSQARLDKVEHVPGFGGLAESSSSLTNPGEYLDFLRAAANGSVKNLGSATVNGVSTTHYHADVDIAKLARVVPQREKAEVTKLVAALKQNGKLASVPIDVWIDHSRLIRRLHITYTVPVTGGEKLSENLTENFSDYGPQPAPKVPSAAQTTNLLSLAGAVQSS